MESLLWYIDNSERHFLVGWDFFHWWQSKVLLSAFSCPHVWNESTWAVIKDFIVERVIIDVWKEGQFLCIGFRCVAKLNTKIDNLYHLKSGELKGKEKKGSQWLALSLLQFPPWPEAVSRILWKKKKEKETSLQCWFLKRIYFLVCSPSATMDGCGACFRYRLLTILSLDDHYSIMHADMSSAAPASISLETFSLLCA